MAIDEAELTQLQADVNTELVIAGDRRREIKDLMSRISSIRLTPRTEIIPAVDAVPAVMDEDGVTIITPAIPATRETTQQVFDVTPIDKNLNAPMDDARRQEIYDGIVAKKAELGF